jgi:hypothetical protein
MANPENDIDQRDFLAKAWDTAEQETYDKDKCDTGVNDVDKSDKQITSGTMALKNACEIKHLYASLKSACECCVSWQEENPFKEDEKAKNKNTYEQYAIVLRQRAHGGHDIWKVESLDINSPLIKGVLNKVFADYPGLDLQVPKLSFSQPFVPLVHRWGRCIEQQKDNNTNQHMELFKNALEDELGDSIKACDHLKATGNILFSHLPLAFIPGETVIRSKNGVLSAGTLTSCETIKENSTQYAVFDVEVVDWNGKMCGFDEARWWVREYNGHRPLIKLDIFPLHLHPDKEALESKLVERGRLFERYRGQHFCHFRGAAFWKHTKIPAWMSTYYSATEKVVSFKRRELLFNRCLRLITMV